MTPSEWAEISEVARAKSFGDVRPSDVDRIDFAMMLVDDYGRPAGYATGSAINAEVFHLKMGGAFPNDVGRMTMKHLYPLVHQHLRALGFGHVLTCVRSENVAVLRHAMRQGYRICGFSNFAGEPLVELSYDLGG